MHKEFDITLENISKTEGHTDLDIKVRNGEVVSAKLKIAENKRFYTQAIRGKYYESVPQLVSRICGTCSVAHLTCCLEAVEKALNIKPSPQTMMLRQLNMYGLMVRDHAMHLYLFCLPDVLGKDSVFEFEGKDKELIHRALHVKGAGNLLCKMIGGRAIHATELRVGGFSSYPKKDKITRVIEELKENRPHVVELIDIFYNCDFKLKREIDFVSLVTPDFSFLEGEVRNSKGLCIPESHYWEHLNRIVKPYSQATGFEFEGHEYMVGAISRMNNNKSSLHPDTKKDVAKALRKFPSKNIFDNNLAQAIEILHSIDKSIEMLETMEIKQEKQPKIELKDCNGVGCIEAPRGTLYYMLSIAKTGNVKYGDIITPSQQNQVGMENDIKAIIPTILDKTEDEIRIEVEKIIRAYDPCMSCASHFLKINWDKS
ncbi:Ni/Fe hydrogenase subunit alpha [Candidatus Aenigmatarchaeota archaeon]